MVLFLRNNGFNVTLFCLITNWGGGDYQLRSAHAAKHVWVAVIKKWWLLHSPPRNVALSTTNLADYTESHTKDET